jgi:tetratricopeptide (TPR) repeat protein
VSAALAAEVAGFRERPDDAQAFDAIEERLFVAGQWPLLADLYQARLAAPAVAGSPRERARVLVRLGRVLAEHLRDPSRAETCFRAALAAEARHRPALAALRRLHSAGERFDVALQIAELELSLEMPADERATLLCDVAEIWLVRLGDAELALGHFRAALEARPGHGAALAGAARACEALGRGAEAAAAWERAAAVLRGPARAEAMVAQARLLASAGEPERAGDLCRRALTEDPRRPDALELLAALAEAAGQWPLVADLLERRFEIEIDPAAHAALALRAGRLALERLARLATARSWLLRAESAQPESAAVQAAFADLERAAGDEAALCDRLARWIALSDPPPVAALVELASIRADAGEGEAAVTHLQRALELAPEDAVVVDALAEALAHAGRFAELADCLERRAALVGSDPRLRAGILVELGALHEERLADPEAALAAYERALDADLATPGLVARMARLCRKTEAWEPLRRALARAAASGPADERAAHWCSLGELLLERLGDAPEAEAAFEAALALDPGAERAHRGRQALAAQAGDPEGVLEAYEREAAVATDRARLGFLIQEIVGRLEAGGRLEATRRWVARWIEACPEEAAPLELAARVARELGDAEDERRALELLDPHLTGAARAGARRRIAEIQAAAERHGEAIHACRAALAADPGDRAARALLVRELEREGRLAEAAAARRELVLLLADAERAAALDELARLQAGRLGDLAGAIATLERLAEEPDAPRDVEERLAALLERSRRFEDLADRLARRRQGFAAGDPERTALGLRLAGLLLDPLARFGAAAEVYRELVSQDPGCEEARRGLERALRAAGDLPGLAAFLSAQAEAHPDRATRERAALEHAALLEEMLARPAEAAPRLRELFEQASEPATRDAAGLRLERLLERERAWPALRQHLLACLQRATPASERAAVHERLARLCRDRLSDAALATEHFEAAAALAPERPELWRCLARLHEEADRPAELALALEGELATGPAPERERAIRARIAHLATGALSDPERARAHYERLLELDPADAAASEFLVAHYEREGRAAELVRLLDRRLAALAQRADADPAARTALRLRIAGLRATRLRDPEGAIALLEPALAELGPLAAIAEPLADLYQRTGRREALEAICRAAVVSAAEGAERAGWLARLAEALRARSADREAVAAYRSLLAERPGDREASAALRELHRRLGEPAPLARLLEAELAYRAGPAEVPLRMELARLLVECLERPVDALLHLRRVLQIEPGHAEALERALALARGESQGELVGELLDEALARPQSDAMRAALLAQRGRLRAGDPGRARDAARDLRESLALDPAPAEVRRALREQLERLEDWPGVLECLGVETSACAPAEREALLEEAAEIAWRRIGPDAALPWLERLRRIAPARVEIAARVAEVHRLAGRTEARVRALEEQESLAQDAAERRSLRLERARVLERELASPARAAAVLGASRGSWPGDPEILDELARLLAVLGRDRERAEVTLERLASAEGELRVRLLREAAELFEGPLGEPDRAAELWSEAALLTPEPGARRAELLRSLGRVLRRSAPSEAWARCAEAELASLDAAHPVFAERREVLHAELAAVYRRIGRPDEALRHLRPLVDAGATGAGRESLAALLEALRAAGAWLELEQRWTTYLERWPDAEGWLELARLREERLHAPARAVLAYRRSLELAPRSLPGIRGLRTAAERIGDFEAAASALELEIECRADAPPAARAELLRHLGDLAWHRLGATTRASRCYAGALEADPEDFAALRALEALLEAMEDWEGAARLYESEVEVLGDRDPERRQAAWLRAGELARDHLGDPERARRAYGEAAALGPLAPARRAELAELQRRCGDLAGFAETLAGWCDDPASGAGASDHRRLAASLEELGRLDLALARVRRALALDPRDLASLDLEARLCEAVGDAGGAALALERAAALAPDREAAARLARASELALAESPDRAAELLRAAAARDPGSASVQARLARSEAARGALADAELAARRALELAAAARDLAPPECLEIALLGARAARALGRLASAAALYAEARRLAPEDPSALGGSAEVLAELEDLAGARHALELRLAHGDAYPERAAHLSLLARCLEAAGDPAGALARCEAALALDPALDEAHARCVTLHERAGHVDLGVAALERWAEAAPDPLRRSERLLRAAEWLVRLPSREAQAEQSLRAVLELDPASARAWQGLAWLLWHRGDVDGALRVASEALAHGADDSARGPLSLLRGRALERQGARADAAAAYALAVAADPRCGEAALAAARLLRGMGDWRGAAETLGRFVDLHPGDDPSALAEALHQQGRLLAGPLEDLEGAVVAYERALRFAPEATELRAALASLLSHRPEHWREALTHQRAVLEREPTHAATLRAALRVAASRGRARSVEDGIAILRALGIATASELPAAPATLSTLVADGAGLDDPLHETLRLLAQQAARELGDALGHSGLPPSAPDDPLLAFRAAAFAAEGRLSAPALLPLPTPELREALLVTATLAQGGEDLRASGRFVNALTAALGRRARRGLRRLLEGISLDALARVDFEAWRSELRGLAAAVALDATGGDLRAALVALAVETSERAAELPPTADLSPLVAASPEARSCLRRVVRAWLSRL